MKIIVNNEAEKRLIQDFADGLSSGLLDFVEIEDHRGAEGSSYEPFLTSDEYRFLNNGLMNVTVEIDTKEWQLEAEGDIVTGNCVVCGAFTEGIIDGGDVGFEEYERLTNKEERDSWKCETCFNKQDQ